MPAELKDDDAGVHIVRLGLLAEALARQLGRDASLARLLRLAAPMRDIGKISIPDTVRRKPGCLTEVPVEKFSTGRGRQARWRAQ